MIKPIHIVVLVLVILLVFGAKKLPEIAGSVGKSMKVFKKEVKELREDDVPEQYSPAPQLQPGQGQPPTYGQPQQPYAQQSQAQQQGYAQPGQQPYPQYPHQGDNPGDARRS